MLNAPPEPETDENEDDVTLPEQNNVEDIEQYLNSEDNNHESSNLEVEEVCTDSSDEIDEPPSKKPRVDSTEESPSKKARVDSTLQKYPEVCI